VRRGRHPDEERGQLVTAFVVLREGHAASASSPGPAGLRQAHHRALQIPARDRIPDVAPRTETGKLQRFRLRQEHVAKSGERTA
jgi:2-aminobenzoate-CoA ligase